MRNGLKAQSRSYSRLRSVSARNALGLMAEVRGAHAILPTRWLMLARKRMISHCHRAAGAREKVILMPPDGEDVTVKEAQRGCRPLGSRAFRPAKK